MNTRRNEKTQATHLLKELRDNRLARSVRLSASTASGVDRVRSLLLETLRETFLKTLRDFGGTGSVRLALAILVLTAERRVVGIEALAVGVEGLAIDVVAVGTEVVLDTGHD